VYIYIPKFKCTEGNIMVCAQFVCVEMYSQYKAVALKLGCCLYFWYNFSLKEATYEEEVGHLLIDPLPDFRISLFPYLLARMRRKPLNKI
jgi:hypothetical protein